MTTSTGTAGIAYVLRQQAQLHERESRDAYIGAGSYHGRLDDQLQDISLIEEQIARAFTMLADALDPPVLNTSG